MSDEGSSAADSSAPHASAAEKFAAAAARAAHAHTELGRFEAQYEFGLDDFQLRACRALEGGHGVLVAAPTGSGKTVVGEFGVHLALAAGKKCFYTTPIKALSNQKFADLVRRYGEDNVGLLTGDNTINGEAPIVIMTTEVLRNMLYAGSATLTDLAYVVMDEVHYLADRFRGAVWEEVIIHLPESVRLISLSATVSNVEEFGEWLQTVRGDTTVVLEEHRPVPLWQHMLLGSRLYDLFADVTDNPGRSVRDAEPKSSGLTINPELARVARENERVERLTDRGSRYRRGGRYRPPSRVEVLQQLDSDGLLPAITFIFSRAGCDSAVKQCLAAGMRLNSADEAEEVRLTVERRTADLPAEDLVVLGYFDWLDGLQRGVAAHHAGMLPSFKEVVEELFMRGLVKAVFATETLALGINMPARSVVLERLVKWNGEAHADITPGEYTQLTGRAGRRGIDIEGHAVVLWSPGMDPRSVAGLASTRTYPLRSSFRPSYNMAVNLVGMVGRSAARELLESSFAQFQADRAVVGLARQVTRHTEALAGYEESMTCHLGDFPAYYGIRRDIKARESQLSKQGHTDRRAETAQSLERLRVGDVIRIPQGRRAGLAIVLDTGIPTRGFDGPRPTVLTAERQVRKLSVIDFTGPVEVAGQIRIPRTFNARNPQSRKDLASSLRNLDLDGRPGDDPGRRARGGTSSEDAELVRLRAALRAHPCHACDQREDHARWAERFWRLQGETDVLQKRVAGRTHVISRQFDRVCTVLHELGYLEGDAVTPAGRRLGRLYTELDLLAAECLRRGVWEGMKPAELAAAASALVFEPRSAETAEAPRIPDGKTREALAEMTRLYGSLDSLEAEHSLDFLRPPELGFVWATYRWASGHRLDAVLAEAGLQAGDFVRWVKQLLDLLGQIAEAAAPVEGVESTVRSAALKAADALRRGVVAYSSVT